MVGPRLFFGVGSSAMVSISLWCKALVGGQVGTGEWCCWNEKAMQRKKRVVMSEKKVGF